MAAGRSCRTRWPGSTARCRPELAEGLRPGDGQLARVAELLDRAPDLLHRGQPDGPPADLGDQRLDPLVVAGRRSPSSRSASLVRRIVSTADSGSAGGSSAMPSVRSSSRISGAVRCRRNLASCSAIIDSACAQPGCSAHAGAGPVARAAGAMVGAMAIGMGTAGQPAARATGTGGGSARPGCWRSPLTRAGRACCCSAGAGGATTAAPGDRRAARGTATSPP